VVAVGKIIKNNLYRMDVQLAEWNDLEGMEEKNITCVLMGTDAPQPWETWHKQFGHISYSSLQKLLSNQLISGMNVDKQSPQPNCVACTEAKMSVKPFAKVVQRDTKLGQLMHINVWGKYDVMSINGHQYYIVFVDNAARYITVYFMKRKDEAAMKVKEYLTYLQTQEKPPKAFQVDRGKEFINNTLISWCREQGIDIQKTAGYSPAQNGIANMHELYVGRTCACHDKRSETARILVGIGS
jgi:hypothetical protein